MNFDDAIHAHSAWKTKLSAYLRKPDQSLRSGDVRPDNLCELGRWIHSAPSTVAATPEFKQLREQHARFHRAAAAIIDMANSGKPTTEATALGSGSEFSEASRNVVTMIMSLKRKVPA